MAETLVQTFLGNVGIGTNDPGAYMLNINGDSNIGPLEVTSLNVNGSDNVGIVPGFIALWYGTVETIPTGWSLCDGNSGRPDIRNRFSIGAGGTTSANATVTGGATTSSIPSSSMPSHVHYGTTYSQNQNHGHDILGSHVHREHAGDDGGRADFTTCQAQVYYQQEGMGTLSSHCGISVSTQSAVHWHSGGATDYTGGGNPYSILPPYRALCYIIKN
jgi:microcystin-dependent protein